MMRGGNNPDYYGPSGRMYDDGSMMGVFDSTTSRTYDDGYDYIHTNEMEENESAASTSFFTPIMPPYAPMIRGSPVSSLAIDPYSNALYVGGHTVRLHARRPHATYGGLGGGRSATNHGHNGGGGGDTFANNNDIDSMMVNKIDRASMLAVHSFTDGMPYSACSGHAEANQNVLDGLYKSIFKYSGESTTSTFASNLDKETNSLSKHHPFKKGKIPSHAYKPPYGSDFHLNASNDPSYNNYLPYQTPDVHEMGITTILPFSSHTYKEGEDDEGGTEGTRSFVCTISPSSVRIHTIGGVMINENNNLRGMMGGAFLTSWSGGSLGKTLSEEETHVPTHVIVGGAQPATIGCTNVKQPPHNLHCLDLYSQGLRAISSHCIRSSDPSSSSSTITTNTTSNDISSNHECCITAIAANKEHGTMVAGCTDGTIRLLDSRWRAGRTATECAQVRAHGGGIVSLDIAENLICTAGYASSNSSMPYTFPEQHVMIFDVRYLGRGGIVHPFMGMKGGPRFVQFLSKNQIPNAQGNYEDGIPQVLIGSGQRGGGLQVITPFKDLGTGSDYFGEANRNNFLHPFIDQTESLTAMTLEGNQLALGTSAGTVLHYAIGENYENTKIPLEALPFGPDAAEISIDPIYLQSESEIVKHPWSIFNVYTMNTEPTVSIMGERGEKNIYRMPSLGPLSENVLRYSGKKLLSSNLIELVSSDEKKDDAVSNVQTSDLNVELLSKRLTKKDKNEDNQKPNISNPNRLLFGSNKVSILCYDVDADPRKKEFKGHSNWRRSSSSTRSMNSFLSISSSSNFGKCSIDDNPAIPQTYKCTYRPPYSIFSSYHFAELNQTLYPGWDYAPAMPNAYSSPVLILLYFVPEVRRRMLLCQLSRIGTNEKHNLRVKQQNSSIATMQDKSNMLLSQELGFLFHQIDSISGHSMSYSTPNSDGPVVGAFAPTNFLSTLSTLPEASALALLDGSAAACEPARKPEAFLRFLVHHLDRELGEIGEPNGTNVEKENDSKHIIDQYKPKLFDSLMALDFQGINEFVTSTGNPTVSTTRGYIIDLAYNRFINQGRPKIPTEIVKEDIIGAPKASPSFAEVLHYSLCKDIGLRAWCQTTRSYETVIQRKIVTSLPKMLCISCACAGINGNEGLTLWRNDYESGQNSVEKSTNHWLPEQIEIEIGEMGNIIVRQLVDQSKSDSERWKEFKGEELPKSVKEGLVNSAKAGNKKVARYELNAVLSHVCTDNMSTKEIDGHHVVHIRIPLSYNKSAISKQIHEIRKCFDQALNEEKENFITDKVNGEFVNRGVQLRKITLNSGVISSEFECREKILCQNLQRIENEDFQDPWVLFNGPVVSKSSSNDARSFKDAFKEPCCVMYKQIFDEKTSNSLVDMNQDTKVTIPWNVINCSPITHGTSYNHSIKSESEIPSLGDLVAFDAEFVQVQNEESKLTASGSKVTVKEGRNALARMSLIDCKTGEIIIDDHVLPREPVVDYLTRFSGIRSVDLDPMTTTHNLITMRNAYLKMRLLVDRGCIFVGHGLSQDFLTLNMYVPPGQIIDTLLIYHQENRRFISLRFLVNYLLGYDMQQDVHDSVEDAKAAFELYLKALELKDKGTFANVLQQIYDFGKRTDWKVGVD